MAAATDAQVQNYVDGRTRPRAELIRRLAILLADDAAVIDDVYEALNAPTPTWADDRTDGPPHLLTPSDVLGIHALAVAVRAAITGHDQYPIVLKACVRSPEA